MNMKTKQSEVGNRKQNSNFRRKANSIFPVPFFKASVSTSRICISFLVGCCCCCCSFHMTMLSIAPLSFHVSLQLQAEANVLYQMISWATAVDTIQSAERNVQYKIVPVPMIFQRSESIKLIETVTRTSSSSHWNVLLEKASSCPQRGMCSLINHVILQARSFFMSMKRGLYSLLLHVIILQARSFFMSMKRNVLLASSCNSSNKEHIPLCGHEDFSRSIFQWSEPQTKQMKMSQGSPLQVQGEEDLPRSIKQNHTRGWTEMEMYCQHMRDL